MKNKKLATLLINMGIIALANQHVSAKTDLAENALDEETKRLKNSLPHPGIDRPVLFEEVKDSFKNNDAVKKNHCCCDGSCKSA